MMRLTELKRSSQIDMSPEDDDDENAANKKETNSNHVVNDGDDGDDDDDEDDEEEIDIFNRVTNLNGDLLPNGHRKQARKKHRRKNVKSQKDKLEKLIQHKMYTETLFMKFFKYILLNLTFALNVSRFFFKVHMMK